MKTRTPTRAAKQDQLAIALGAAAAFVCLPDDRKEASAWLTAMDRNVRSWGYERLPADDFIVKFYDALDESGFLDHLRACVARREDMNADGSPFEVTPPEVEELAGAMRGNASSQPAEADDEHVFGDEGGDE